MWNPLNNPTKPTAAGLGLGTMATQNANNVAISGGTITGIGAPSAASDVAIKSYVDAGLVGLSIKQTCRVATTGALTVTYANGSSGVGATLTNATTQSAISIDTVSLSVGDRVLVKNQVSTFQNGIYTVTTVGSGASNWVLTRATDFDTTAEITLGAWTIIDDGVVAPTGNKSTQWFQASTAPATIGTDAITFVNMGSAFLLSGNNLSDIGTAATAATNLGLGAASDVVHKSVTAYRPMITISGTSRTLALTDVNSHQVTTNGSATTVTIPPNSSVAFPVGTEMDFFQQGAGQCIFAAGSGVTIQSKSGNLKLTGQYSGGTIKQLSADTWSLVGDLAA